jgi:poly(3-hydroxybutyrate) depolymerase
LTFVRHVAWLPAILALALPTGASAAPLATGPDGWLATFRVTSTVEPDPRTCETCRVVASASERLDLSRLARSARTVDLSFVARTARPTVLHLFVGLRGELEVLIDGRPLARFTRWVDRVDERHVALPLTGEHVITLRTTRIDDDAWTLRVRLLDEGFTPGPGDVSLDVGPLSEDDARRLAREAVSVHERRELAGVDPVALTSGRTIARANDARANDARANDARANDPRANRSDDVRTDVPTNEDALPFATPIARLTIAPSAGGVVAPIALRLGDVTRGLDITRGRYERVALDVPIGARGGLPIDVRVDDSPLTVGAGIALDRPLLDALAELARALDAPESTSLSPVSRASATWRLREALRVIDVGDPDARWRAWLASEARDAARAIRAGRDPFATRVGYQRLAHPSALDGTPQPFELFVPPGRAPRTGWPVLITLHGFKGNNGDYFRNTFGLERDWRGGESLDDHGRNGVPPSGAWGGVGPVPTHGPMIVIAPEARGQTHYRHAGEIDVLEALAAVRARHPVDPRRLYVTGGSMGGTGAIYLPYRNPDLFAASAALAGYHDQRVRQDTHHDALSDVERFLVAERSDVDWAENGSHLPTLLVRGTRDRPLEWTRALTTRLRALRFPFEHREPALGHNVWTETYANGAIFTWLGRHTRAATPHHVRLRTGRERTDRAHWLRDVARAAPDRFAEVEAHVGDTHVELITRDVAALTLAPPHELVPSARPLRIDGVEVGVALQGGTTLELVRDGTTWRVGSLERSGRKQAGVSGPIRDVYHDRLVFVVGTLDPTQTWMNRRVAEHWAHPVGWDTAYPIVDDVDVTPEQIEHATLVLIGGPRSNDLVARWRRELPLRFDGDAIVVGDERHEGAEVGAVFVAPHPDVDGRAVLVIAGTTPLGTWRATFLPDLLPDYVVFDERIENARGQWSCGGARRDDGSPNFAEPVPCAYRAHGFFGMRWELATPATR